MTEKKLSDVFPMGEPNDAYAQYFSGKSYLHYPSTEQVTMFNVTFALPFTFINFVY